MTKLTLCLLVSFVPSVTRAALIYETAGYGRCAQWLLRGLGRVEGEGSAARRIQRIATEYRLGPLDANEVTALRDIERLIRPDYFFSTAVTATFLHDYAGPRERLAQRLESTRAWLRGLENGMMIPNEVPPTFKTYAEAYWPVLRAAMGLELERVRWTKRVDSSLITGDAFVSPLQSLAHANWPGETDLADILAQKRVPIAGFFGVATPWPVLTWGRIVEAKVLVQTIALLGEAMTSPESFNAFLHALNVVVLEEQLLLYKALARTSPEFESRTWARLVQQWTLGEPHPVLKAYYFGNTDFRYVERLRAKARRPNLGDGAEEA